MEDINFNVLRDRFKNTCENYESMADSQEIVLEECIRETRVKDINNIWELIKDHWFFNDLIDPYFKSYVPCYNEISKRGRDSIEMSRNIFKNAANEVKRELKNGLTNNTPWLYYLVYTFPIIWLTGLILGGNWLLMMPLYMTVILPILEITIGDEKINPVDKDYKKLQEDKRYMWALWLWPIIEILTIVGGGFAINVWDLSSYEMLILGISTGLLNGAVSINVSHELIHRSNNMERTLGQIMLTMVMYPHFYIEHLFGHHKNIGTSLDAGTSRRNETLYSYWPRAIITAYSNAWTLANKHRRGHIMYLYHLFVLMFLWFMFSINGLYGLLYTILQGVIAILYLETANYIEHYGILRNENDKITLMHSWNTDKVTTNYLSFKLQRHSDHHKDARRRYPNLRNFEDTPKLPTGYAGSILIATIPRLWFKLMNPKLDKLYPTK